MTPRTHSPGLPRIAVACALLAASLGVLSSCGRKTAPAARCGDGRVDEGEACDLALAYQLGCPEGWGVCMTCRPDCSIALAASPFRNEIPDPLPSQSADQLLDTSLALEVEEYRLGDSRRLIRREKQQRNGRGQLERTWVDDDGDGVTDYVTVYEFDEHGLALSRKRVIESSEAAAAHGPMHERWRYTYDDEGRPIEKKSGCVEDRGTCVVSSYSYDSRGRLAEAVVRSGARPNISTIERLAYGDRGYLERRWSRHDGKQVPSDPDEHWTTSRFGKPLTLELVVDGKTVSRFEWDYDERHLLTRYREDWDLDGTPENGWVNTYDATGLRTSSSSLAPGSPSRTTYERDDAGRVRRALLDRDGDGTPEKETLYRYDDEQLSRWSDKAPIRRPLAR